MLKNIQKYLLLHYPLIWNVRFVPMVLIIILLHLMFFGIGYAVTDTSFSKTYHYGDELPMLYFVSILIDVLLFIGWLVFYNRNNGFKSFYPRKTGQLYMEWIMIFVIVAGLALVPITLTVGHLTKWRSIASLDEAKKAEALLDKVKVLIPNESDRYKFDAEYLKPIPAPENMRFQADTLSRSLYSFDYDWSNNTMHLEGYIGHSLLFYMGYDYAYYYKDNLQNMDSDDKRQFLNEELVKKWLSSDEKDSIFTVMAEFEKLRLKHHLRSNISPERWFSRIYNPPFFPVKGSTAIMNREQDDTETYYTAARFDGTYIETSETIDEDGVVISQYKPDTSEVLPYLPYENLQSGYEQILKYYNYDKDLWMIVLVCLCTSIFISCLVFSFRFSKGKSWLIALISTGILIFITILLSVFLREFIDWDGEVVALCVLSIWIALFVIMLTRIILKIKSKDHKGKSEIYLNLLVWMVSAVIPLAFFFYLVCYDISDMPHYKGKEDDIIMMFWVNIPIVIVGMYFVASLIRKWKSLGDQ